VTNRNKENCSFTEAYDTEAEESGYFGPEVVFGLIYKFIQPKSDILDIGIGTGLGAALFRKAGLNVYGMDFSQNMLDACRGKGFTNLALHDLTKTPYPYDSASMDCAVCIGVMIIFADLTPIFTETARILRKDGIFGFIVGNRAAEEPTEVVVRAEHSHMDEPITMFLHSEKQILDWLEKFGFELLRNLDFTVYMDKAKNQNFRSKAYIVKKY